MDCINCGRCEQVCQINIDQVKNCNYLECIRCARCKITCSVEAISYGVKTRKEFSKKCLKMQ